MDQSTLSDVRAALEKERDSLERQLADLGAPISGADLDVDVDEGFADSAHATAERSQLLSVIGRLQATYAEVTAALLRLDSGTYGKCERCGRDIPIERLQALPTARLCVDCKQLAGS
jgi:DnaK suppressor protein